MANLNSIFLNPLGSAKGIFYFTYSLPFLLVLCSLTSLSQPQLKITESKQNFGFVKRGEVINTVFEISNAGNQPLLITEGEVSCSCTTVDFPREPILPGEKKNVTVIFKTATVYGRQDRVVLLHSNDPKGPYKLRYKGTVSNK